MLLAAEELLLFLLDEQNATLLPMTVRTEHLVLAGAVLMDLQLANRIDTDLDNLTVSNPTPLGDDVLDPTLADIVGAEKTHDALYWVERTARRGHEIRERTIARLVSRGILLAPGDEGFLSLTPEVAHARRYPSTNGAVQEDVKLRIMRVLFSEDIPAPADIVVVSLVNACDVWRKLLTAEELVKARKRIEIVSRLDLVGRAVATLVGIVRPTAPAARGAAAGLPLARGLPLVGSTFAVWRDPRKFFVTHDLPEHFPHPERFDIDRYLPGREEHKQPGVFTPFGVGVHHCAGRGFAETQLPLIVATLLHEAEMELVPATYELKTERWMRSGRQPRAAPGARRGIPVGARVRLRTAGRPWSPQPRRCASISSTSHPGPPPTSPRAAPARGPCLEGIADSSRLHPLIGARRERHDAVRRRPDSPRPAKATGRARGLQPVGNRRHRHAAVEVGRTTVTGLGADGASAPSGRTGRSDAGHRQFGNLTRIQEQSHYVFAFRHVEDLLKDLRYGVRMVLKHPGFSATAIIVLALGIGANSAIFNVINAMLLKPLPIHRPGELVGVYVERTTAPGGYRPFSYPNFQDLREQAAAFANLAAHNVTLVGIGDGEATRRVWADAVTANYFETFGVPLALGRAFTAAEEQPGANLPVAIVSHDYWVREGRRPDVLGETILVNAEPLTIVGVAAAGFTGSSVLFRPEVWLPLGLYGTVATDIVGTPSGSLREPDNYTLMVKGRLRPGHSVESVAPELEAIAARLSRAYPATNEDRTLRAAPLPRLDVSTSPTTDGQFAALSALVLGMAGMVLLIACLNLANMLLARGASRRREMAIRLSLGGGRGFAFERGLLLETDPSLAGYDEVQERTVYRDLLPRLRALPGVDAVSMASMVPFGSFSESRMAVPVGADDQGERAASFTLVADDYFRALGPAER